MKLKSYKSKSQQNSKSSNRNKPPVSLPDAIAFAERMQKAKKGHKETYRQIGYFLSQLEVLKLAHMAVFGAVLLSEVDKRIEARIPQKGGDEEMD